jgi:transcriptional regulator with XRE-family HTH domain
MPDNARKIFAENLAFLLDEKGVSQVELARALNVATGTVSGWVNGKKYPRADAMEKIAERLGVRMSILVAENGRNVFETERDEAELLAAFRRADPITQSNVRKLLNIPEREKKENAG